MLAWNENRATIRRTSNTISVMPTARIKVCIILDFISFTKGR